MSRDALIATATASVDDSHDYWTVSDATSRLASLGPVPEEAFQERHARSPGIRWPDVVRTELGPLGSTLPEHPPTAGIHWIRGPRRQALPHHRCGSISLSTGA